MPGTLGALDYRWPLPGGTNCDSLFPKLSTCSFSTKNRRRWLENAFRCSKTPTHACSLLYLRRWRREYGLHASQNTGQCPNTQLWPSIHTHTHTFTHADTHNTQGNQCNGGEKNSCNPVNLAIIRSSCPPCLDVRQCMMHQCLSRLSPPHAGINNSTPFLGQAAMWDTWICCDWPDGRDEQINVFFQQPVHRQIKPPGTSSPESKPQNTQTDGAQPPRGRSSSTEWPIVGNLGNRSKPVVGRHPSFPLVATRNELKCTIQTWTPSVDLAPSDQRMSFPSLSFALTA